MNEQVFRVADTQSDLVHDEVTNAIAEALRNLMARTDHEDLTSWLTANPTGQWLTLSLLQDGDILGTETVFAEDK